MKNIDYQVKAAEYIQERLDCSWDSALRLVGSSPELIEFMERARRPRDLQRFYDVTSAFSDYIKVSRR